MLDQSTLDNLRRLITLESGIARMAMAPVVTINPTPRTCVFQEGLAKLYRYRPEDIGAKPKQNVHPLLIVYALVNRPGMLDLQPDRSFIRRLLEAGIEVHLIDWLTPTRTDQHYSLNDYILGDIHACVRFLLRTYRVSSLHLAGVCQGGTFATVYASLFPNLVQTLIPLVTPIQFDLPPGEGLLFTWAKQLNAGKIARAHGLVPASLLMVGFEQLRPFQRVAKYVEMTEWANDSDKLLNFLRLEQWLYQCPPLTGPAFQESVEWFYQENRLYEGTLELEGRPALLERITCPLLNVYAEEDHIVPPSSSIPLNDRVGSQDITTLPFAGGHIGVFVSGRTQHVLAPAVADWLLTHD